MPDQSNHVKHLVMAAGGTGGHIFPSQALAEEMLKRGWRVDLWTDSRGLDFCSNFPNDVNIRQIASGTYSRGNIINRMIAPTKLAVGIVTSWIWMRQQKPSVVVGFGGYPAFPPLLASYFSKIPSVIHEQNSVLGLANRLLSRKVNIVVCGIECTNLSNDVNSIIIGNPVREQILACSGTEYKVPEKGQLNLLILGGSQGSTVMDRILPKAIVGLPDSIRSRLNIVQQARPENKEEILQSYNEAGLNCRISHFFDDVPRLMEDSHLIVARAGASTVSEITAMGRPSILIPFGSAANDHQTANAKVLMNYGATISISENEVNPKDITTEIVGLFENPNKAESMAQAAKKTARLDATEKFADIIENLAITELVENNTRIP